MRRGAAAIMKTVPQLGCVSQDSEPSRLPKGVKYQGTRRKKFLGSIRRVRFTQSTLRQALIRENKCPSLGQIQVKVPHQRSPNAMKFDDRSQEETERQQRCARDKAWNLAKNIYKLKEKEKATFSSPSEEWAMSAASTINSEERRFVVDSGASMHKVSKRDLNSAELDTMRISKNPTTVMTANGEVLTREEATENAKELELFGTVVLLEDTLAVLLLGKLCEDHGKTYRWTVVKNHISPKMARTSVATDGTTYHSLSWSVDEFLYFIFTYFFNIFIAVYGD